MVAVQSVNRRWRGPASAQRVDLFVSFAETPPGCMALRRHAESEPADEATAT
jgi:hypothetical protein